MFTDNEDRTCDENARLFRHTINESPDLVAAFIWHNVEHGLVGRVGDPRQPAFTTFGHAADGAFQATVTCAATNFLCVLEASTNLVQWTKLSVRANTTGTVQFDDPGATNRPARFYRVMVP